MNDYGPKMAVLKEMYDNALMSRKKKTPKKVMRKEDGDFGADEFQGLEHKPGLTITLISGEGMPESDMMEDAMEEKAEGEDEEDSEGDMFNKGKGHIA